MTSLVTVCVLGSRGLQTCQIFRQLKQQHKVKQQYNPHLLLLSMCWFLSGGKAYRHDILVNARKPYFVWLVFASYFLSAQDHGNYLVTWNLIDPGNEIPTSLIQVLSYQAEFFFQENPGMGRHIFNISIRPSYKASLWPCEISLDA